MEDISELFHHYLQVNDISRWRHPLEAISQIKVKLEKTDNRRGHRQIIVSPCGSNNIARQICILKRCEFL